MGKQYRPRQEKRLAGGTIQLLSRAQSKLEKSLKTISHRRRKSIKLRPLTDYSDHELQTALKLDPDNIHIIQEVSNRSLRA